MRVESGIGDILFRNESQVFSYRVGGIMELNGRMLFQREPGDSGFAVPGGHVAFGETAAETLAREMMEETGAAVRVGELLATGEVFFRWGKRECHQICLYYSMQLTDPGSMPTEGVFPALDELENERMDLEFCWVSPEELAAAPLYPEELRPALANPGLRPYHFVSGRQIHENEL